MQASVRGEGATVEAVSALVRAMVEGVEIVTLDYESDVLPGQVVVDQACCGGTPHSVYVETYVGMPDEPLRRALVARGWQVS